MEFSGEGLSSNAGLMLFAGLDRALGFTRRVAGSLRDSRCAGKVRHTQLGILRHRVMGLLAGYEDGNDASRLRREPTFRVVGDKSFAEKDTPPSQPTVSRFENELTATGLLRWSHVLCDFVLEQEHARHSDARRVTIDLDPTDDPTYGAQQLTFFNAFYDTWCYLPAACFVSFHDRHGRQEKEQHLVATMLRPGNAHATVGAIAILRRVIGKLRRLYPKIRIRVRLDGGYATPKMFRFLESQPNVEYLTNMAKNVVLKRKAKRLLGRARRLARLTGKTATVYGNCRYKASKWKRPRRVIIKAEVTISPREPHKKPRDNPRFVVTNLKTAPRHVYRQTYIPRGDVENRIKELHDLSLGRTSCTKFLANQTRVLLAATAFILIQEMRAIATGTRAALFQAGTFRTRLIKFAAMVVGSTRRAFFRLARHAPEAELFSELGQRVALLDSG